MAHALTIYAIQLTAIIADNMKNMLNVVGEHSKNRGLTINTENTEKFLYLS